MRRAAFLGSFLSLLLATAACEERIAEPAPEASTGPQMSVVADGALGLSAEGMERPTSLTIADGQLSDAELVRAVGAAADVINPGDYQCAGTPPVVLSYVDAFNQLIAEEFDIFFFLYINVWADLLPQYEALIFLEEDRQGAEYGYHGEFTNQVKSTIKDLRRFSDIDGDIINIVPMKGTMLQDRDRVATAYQSPLVPPFGGLSEADAYFVADQIQLALDASNLLDGGNHELFSFNAFAFGGSAGLGIPPKIIMGDAIMNAYADFGLGDVAPQGILAHEYAHHVQFQRGYFDDEVPTLNPPVTPPEETRYTELMADAWSAYYLTHSRGGTLRQKRVEQFLEVFFQIGDCSFTSPGHHGTPIQRMRAAQWGFDLASQAQKQGHILSSDEFHDLFYADYLTLIAPDA